MARPRFRQLAHTADLRLAVWGADEGELIANAVAGTINAAAPGMHASEATLSLEIDGWPAGLAPRLVRAINEALFWLYTRRHVAVGFDAAASPPRLALTPLPEDHVLTVELKAATFHDLHPSSSGNRMRVILTLDL